jgi:hypothetical protein
MNTKTSTLTVQQAQAIAAEKFDTWLAEHGLPSMSAMELLAQSCITEEQRAILTLVVDAAEDAEYAEYTPDTELACLDDGTYRFISGGIQIDNPFFSENFFDNVTPEYYGFTVWETGGGCTAWRRDFTLHGVPVYMLITDRDASHEVGPYEPFVVGVYTADVEAWAVWNVELIDGDTVTGPVTVDGNLCECIRNAMCSQWTAWCAAQGLECRSADEMDLSVMNDEQRRYTHAFIVRWEAMDRWEAAQN